MIHSQSNNIYIICYLRISSLSKYLLTMVKTPFGHFLCYVVTIISCLGENHSKYCCGGCDSFALSGKTFLCSGIIFASEFRGPEFEPSNCLGTSILLLEVASSNKRNEIFSPHWWIGGGGGEGKHKVQFRSNFFHFHAVFGKILVK